MATVAPKAELGGLGQGREGQVPGAAENLQTRPLPDLRP
jgi:hypothetical protein